MSELRESEPTVDACHREPLDRHDLAERAESLAPAERNLVERNLVERAGEGMEAHAHVPAGQVDFSLRNQQRFVERCDEAMASGTYEPGRIRIQDARAPFREHPGCIQPDRYVYSIAAQREVEARFREHGVCRETLEAVNPMDSYAAQTDARDYNCAECTRAVASLLNGQPEAAMPLLPDAQGRDGERISQMELWSGRESLKANWYEGAAVGEGFAAVELELRAAGPGSHAAVFIETASSFDAPNGHWFNVANIGGEIYYIDAQNRGPFLCARATSEKAGKYQEWAQAMTWTRMEQPSDA